MILFIINIILLNQIMKKKNIDDMKVYVKYNEKFTPKNNDYKEEVDVIEIRNSYVEKEIYDKYHEELDR